MSRVRYTQDTDPDQVSVVMRFHCFSPSLDEGDSAYNILLGYKLSLTLIEDLKEGSLSEVKN